MPYSSFANFVSKYVNDGILQDPSLKKFLPRDDEYTTVAMLFLTNKKDIIPLTWATGTKATNQIQQHLNPFVLHDMHAEVICRRSLVLLCTDPQIEKTISSLLLNHSYEIWLYSSEVPCGDASILQSNYNEENSSISKDTTRIGAKVYTPFSNNIYIEPRDENNVPMNQRGQLRTKCKRSDSKQHPTSLSCSDKICLWSKIGLLPGWFKNYHLYKIKGIVIDTPVNSHEYTMKLIQQSLNLSMVLFTGTFGKYSRLKKSLHMSKTNVYGLSVNGIINTQLIEENIERIEDENNDLFKRMKWSMEIVNGKTGLLRHSVKKRKSEEEDQDEMCLNMTSRLCKYNFYKNYKSKISYREFKLKFKIYIKEKNKVKQGHDRLRKWIRKSDLWNDFNKNELFILRDPDDFHMP